MNIKEIKDMINLMNENNLEELEMEKDGFKIRLKKIGGQIQQTISGPHIEPLPGPRPLAMEEAPRTEGAALIEIKSPMVGTFYRAPSPESAPFVDIGAEIEPGQVICIIEAMKLMNEIKAEAKGRIKEILVENGNPVEFGQTLFRLEAIS